VYGLRFAAGDLYHRQQVVAAAGAGAALATMPQAWPSMSALNNSSPGCGVAPLSMCQIHAPFRLTGVLPARGQKTTKLDSVQDAYSDAAEDSDYRARNWRDFPSCGDF